MDTPDEILEDVVADALWMVSYWSSLSQEVNFSSPTRTVSCRTPHSTTLLLSQFHLPCQHHVFSGWQLEAGVQCRSQVLDCVQAAGNATSIQQQDAQELPEMG